MKKRLALLLALSMCMGVVGCGSGDTKSGNDAASESENTDEVADEGAADEDTADEDAADSTEEETVTLRFMGWGTPAETEILQQAIDSYYEETNGRVKVEMEIVSSDYDTKMTTLVAANNEPDIAMMEGATIAFPIADEGKFVNLKPYFEDTDSEMNLETIEENVLYWQDPETLIGVGTGLMPFMLYYNVDMFEAAGIEAPPTDYDNAWTWDQFVEVCQLLTLDTSGRNAKDPDFDPENIEQYGLSFSKWWALYAYMFYTNGTDYISEDGGTLTATSPEAAEAIQNFADLIYKYHVSLEPAEEAAFGDSTSAMRTNKLAMTIDGHWMTGTMASQGVNFGVAVPPVMKEKATVVASTMLTVFKSSEHVEEAVAFLQYLINPNTNLANLTNGTTTPVLKSWYTDADKLDLWINPEIHKIGYEEAVASCIEHSIKGPNYYLKNMGEIMNVINPALDKVWSGEQTAEEALGSVAADAQAVTEGRRQSP